MSQMPTVFLDNSARQSSLPVLFLDVDGVLIPHSADNWTETLDLACVAQVQRIVQATRARVVLSSQWRRSESKCRKLERAGIPLYDTTPFVAESRAAEIAKWLRDARKREGATPPFIILDDSDDARIDGHFVQVDSTTGLTAPAADAAIALLRNGANAEDTDNQ